MRNLHVWVGGAVTLLLVVMHVMSYSHLTGLYRDEVSGVVVATQPTWAEFWELLQFESFGLVWFAVLRTWCTVVGSDHDSLLRLLGLADGLLILAAIWFAARRMGAGAPVLALALAALHPVVVRWSGTVRGYGLGAALIVLLFALVWQVVCDPKPRRVAAMAVVALLAVHTVYYNAVLFMAMGLAGMLVCAKRRQWKRALLIGGVGIGCAVTMVPYINLAHRAGLFNDLIKSKQNAASIFEALSFTLNLGGPGVSIVWVGAVLLIVLYAIYRSRSCDMTLYCGCSLLLGCLGFCIFISALGYPIWAPYFVIIMVLIGICADGVAARWWSSRHGPALAAMLLVVVCLIYISPLWRQVRGRLTNVDEIAHALSQEAARNDLIIVRHWSTGVTFQRYYTGQAPWQTVPPLKDHRVHRYDQLKSVMQQEDPLAILRKRIQEVLKAGGRVWYVRSDELVALKQSPPLPPAAPAWGWHLSPYINTWQALVDDYFIKHSQRIARADDSSTVPVMRAEKFHMAIAEGWR